MTAPELKPCPFCGEKMPPHDDTSWVRCYGCGAETGWRPTGDEAAAAWNRRADLHDDTKAQLADCEARLRKAVEELKFIQINFTYFIARKPQKMMLPETVQFVLDRINAVLAEIEKGGV